MLKKLFLLVLLLSITGICFAQGTDQGEQLTITTYYPSPYGVYKNLRIFPYDAAPPTCDNNSTGLQYYSGTFSCSGQPAAGCGSYAISAQTMYYCNGTTWVSMGGGGGGSLKCVQAQRYRDATGSGTPTDSIKVISGDSSAVESYYDNGTSICAGCQMKYGLKCINGYQRVGCTINTSGASNQNMDQDLYPPGAVGEARENTCLSDDNEYDIISQIGITCCKVE